MKLSFIATLGTAAMLLTACGGAAKSDFGGSGNGSNTVIAISTTGKLSPKDRPDPVPIGAKITFDGWTAVLAKAEFSTQSNSDPSNPRAAVIQMELRITAPTTSEASYDRSPPFTSSARINGTDMVPCAAVSEYVPIAPGTTRTVKACLAYRGSDAAVKAKPTPAITVRYGAFREVAVLEVGSTRGPDY